MTICGNLSDREFTALIAGGDERVFSHVFKQYFTSLCYFANKFVFDRQAAEDVVEEVFEKLWKGNVRISDALHLRAYLYMATKHGCIDHLRKSDHAKERQMNFAEQIGNEEPEHVQHMIRAEVLREIYLEIKNLPEQG